MKKLSDLEESINVHSNNLNLPTIFQASQVNRTTNNHLRLLNDITVLCLYYKLTITIKNK